ncbi:class II aldolase/adducin family protein [Candidatus Altiarchaeota archaeon]
MSVKESLRRDVLLGAKAVFNRGLVETGEGNTSARVPGKEELFITPTFNDYESLSEGDIVHVNFDGKVLSDGRQPSSEYRLHAAIYEAHKKANCVIHTHSPYATMLSVARISIPVLLEEMLIFLGGSVEVSDFGVANTDEISERAVKALGKSNGILMANHGVVVCGRNMEHTVKMAELVEKMARVYWGASQIGKPKEVPKEGHAIFLEKFNSKFSTH